MTDRRVIATQALIKSMKQRFPNKGFQIHSNIDFCNTSKTVGLGVIATSNISKDEILLVIPESTIFCVSSISTVKHLSQKVEQRCEQSGVLDNDPHHPQDFSLALVAMYVLAQTRQRNKEGSVAEEQEDPWTLQADTWPSEEEMKDSSVFYFEDDKQYWGEGRKKNTISVLISGHCHILRKVFDFVIYPVLKESNSLDWFCLADPQQRDDSSSSEELKETLWEAFRYAFSLVWSRGHQSSDGGIHVNPIVDLFNGHSMAASVNVSISQGKWPFLKGGMYRDDYNLACTALYASRDILKGEELLLSYGSLPPSGFMVKYGAIPRAVIATTGVIDNVCIWCPPDMIPLDSVRIQALKERNHFPLEEVKMENTPLTTLDIESLHLYQQNFQEAPALGSMRQFVILCQTATDSEVQQYVDTGRLQLHKVDHKGIGLGLCKILDYNLARLGEGSSSQLDMELADEQESYLDSVMFLARVCERETLYLWRHLICQNYGILLENEHDDYINVDVRCRVCGRSYPKLTCSKCKWRGGSVAANYCSRQHQKKDWKEHKLLCIAEN